MRGCRVDLQDGRLLFYVIITFRGNRTFAFPNYAPSHARARHNIITRCYPTRDGIENISTVRVLRWK